MLKANMEINIKICGENSRKCSKYYVQILNLLSTKNVGNKAKKKTY